MFKTRLDTFGIDFGHFWNFAIFLIFSKIFEDSTFHGKLGKIFFVKITLKQVWILLGTLLGIFGILKIFFLKIFEDSTFHGKLGRNFSKSLPQNTFKTCLETFGNTFGHFWKFEKIFLNIFENSTLHRTLGKKIFGKFDPKQVQNTFGYFWERFWAFLDF